MQLLYKMRCSVELQSVLWKQQFHLDVSHSCRCCKALFRETEEHSCRCCKALFRETEEHSLSLSLSHLDHQMANLNIDSPISRQIVLSFLDFLKSVEPTPSADLEGLEVVRECLEDVFKLNSSSIDDQIQPGLLIDYFRSLHTNKQPDSNLGCVATFPDAPSTSSSRDADESLSHIPRAQNADFSGEPNTPGVLKDELFGQFFAALDKIHFFSTTSDGEDDRGRLDRATNLFHKAVKELEGSGSQTIDSLSLSEMFKSQGNKAMQSKLYSDAVELYTYAIALCPNNSVYYCNRAAAFTQIHKYVEAISDCRKSIEIDPNYSKAYSRLGLAYYAQGNYRDAIDKGFTKALQLDPDNDSVKENIQVAQQKLRVQHRTEHQNQRSTNHSNQESANGEARGGSMTFTSTTFNPADLSSDITSMLMNLVGQNSQQRRNDDSETGRSDEEPETRIDEPEIRIGGNISMNFGDDIPEDLMGTLSSVMEMLSGAQQNQNQNQNPQDNTHRGPTPN